MTNKIIPKGSYPDWLKPALGRASNDIDSVESVEASYGLEPGTLLDLLNTDEGMKAAMVAEGQMKQDGTLLKWQALKPLEKLVARVDAMIDAGDVSASAAPRLLDVLYKITGIAEQRGALLRLDAERDKPLPTICILHVGDPDPEQAQEGQFRIVIDLRGKDRPSKAIDITPDDGGE